MAMTHTAPVPSRIHGGPGAAGPARYDFSTNANACGPCPAALAAVQSADATRYPDGGYTTLRVALAALHGVDAWRIVPAASASEFIFRVTAWVCRQGGGRVWIPQPAYGDYGHAAQAWGLAPVAHPDKADLAWACDPSSPLGRPPADWPAWLDREPGSAGLPALVLDCAYAPLRLTGQPGLDALRADRAWRLFTPNKALGLTGIRAAYAIAPLGAQAAAQQLEALAPSWPIGAHGEAMLRAWCTAGVQEWVAQCLPVLRQWKAAQQALLQALGWHCLESDTPFFCACPPAYLPLAECLAFLRAQGVQLRDATSLGLPGHVRLGVQPPAAQLALQAALEAHTEFLETTA